MAIRCNNCFEEYDEKLGICPFCGYAEGDMPNDAFCLLPGTVLNKHYVIGEKINSGGFGIVYKAWDKTLETVVAIKEYYPSGLVNRLPGETNVILVATKREREFVHGKKRFLTEARNMAKFSSHKNIVYVYQFFEENNTAYIVMEYMDGNPLSKVLQQQNVPLPYDYCVNVASEVCAALREIHKENILHRDVSPDNIMICNDGTVKLFDFGAARFSAEMENKVTKVVKPGFAPPEQYETVNHQDPRTDIYALGATLYYAMTGIKPEESTDRKPDDTLVEPSSIDSSIPQSISTAIMRAMAIEQQYRFANVDEFEKALLSEKSVATVKEEQAKRKRRRFFGIAAALMIICGAAGVFLHLYGTQKAGAGLPDAELDVWYIQTGVEEQDQAKAAALGSICETFTNEFSNVTINLNPIACDNYESALAEAFESGNYPEIYESTGKIDISADNLQNLSDSMSELKESSYYNDQLNPDTVYPAGIVVPIIYMNATTDTSVEEISNLDQLIETCKLSKQYFVVKESAVDLYAPLYGAEIANYATESACDEFFSRNAFAYFGDSSDYFDIQSELPGEYSLLMPMTDNATYKNGTTWSATKQDEDTAKSAAKLVSYFTSDLAQDYFYIQNRGGDLPIMKSSMAEFLDVYNELSSVEEYLSRPFVAPSNNLELLLNNADSSKIKELIPVSESSFEDVPSDAWYAEAISDVCAKGLMSGITDMSFAPDDVINKRDVVTSLYRLTESLNPTDAKPLQGDSVGTEDEFVSAVAWAYQNGIISKSTDNSFSFDGDVSVNFETAMVFFARYAEYLKLDVSSSTDVSIFSDASDISPWAIEGIQWGIDHNIISAQSGSSIGPKVELTRGRYAVLLQRLLIECT